LISFLVFFVLSLICPALFVFILHHVKQERRAKAVTPSQTFWEKILGRGPACAEADCTTGRLDKPFVGHALSPAGFLWSASWVLTGKRERLLYNL
jgi:hypothetical protein